jgi:hypothetical protein
MIYTPFNTILKILCKYRRESLATTHKYSQILTNTHKPTELYTPFNTILKILCKYRRESLATTHIFSQNSQEFSQNSTELYTPLTQFSDNSHIIQTNLTKIPRYFWEIAELSRNPLQLHPPSREFLQPPPTIARYFWDSSDKSWKINEYSYIIE